MQTGRLERLGTPMRRLYCPETCLDQSFSLSRLGTPMRRTPSANHLHGLRLLGKSESLPALPWWSANLPPPTKPLPPLASLGQTPYRYSAMLAGGLGRPLTPAMQMEMARLRFSLRGIRLALRVPQGSLPSNVGQGFGPGPPQHPPALAASASSHGWLPPTPPQRPVRSLAADRLRTSSRRATPGAAPFSPAAHRARLASDGLDALPLVLHPA